MIIITQLFKHYFYLISIFTVGRVILFFTYFDRFNAEPDYWFSFLYGVRMDTITALIFLVPILLIISFLPKFFAKISSNIITYYYAIILGLVIFIEAATFPFFAEYDTRPNYLFVEYLKYPKEVFNLLLADYKLAFFIAFLLIFLALYVYLTKIKNKFQQCFEIKLLVRILLFFPLFIVFFIGIRSSFGHRPANISDALFSSNRILNEVSKNSTYSVLYSIYANQGDYKVSKYGAMAADEAVLISKKFLNINSDKDVFSRMIKSNFKSNNSKNLVIFVQESIGAQFVGVTGGRHDITPNINKLAKQGILFKDAYSNGTRSIRGLAGLSAGNFSVPGAGVLKRNKAQYGFFTVAKLLKKYHYKSSFIYGGESRFDNMKSWYSGNGFDKIIEEQDFINPKFVGSWGVSDEDLIIRANQEFIKYHNNNQKFVSVMFSTSNHAPFDFPENDIELVNGAKVKSVENTIKYADYAIGKFIQLARKQKYYQDTIFVIVADHNIRVYGDEVVPVNMFHIPAIILGGGVKPMIYNKIATQPDILATALDLLGIDDLQYPIMGHSIFSDKKQNIALMQFNDYYALRQDNNVAVIRPDKKPLSFLYKNKTLIPVKHNDELEKNALALITVLNYIYNNKLYQ